MSSCDLGLIGLAVMGQNLVLNFSSRGFRVAVFNRTAAKTRDFLAGPAAGKNIGAAETVSEFCSLLKPPRRIILMVQAGEAVDRMIAELRPHLAAGDLIADAGNSLYTDTERRRAELSAQGLHYLGIGVSGGEEGALNGPSIMVGGSSEAYALLAPALTAIAAKVDGEPCAAHLGPGGAGHFVKMAHNGIEYGYMQIIAELYDGFHRLCHLPGPRLSRIFSEWNQGELGSYLIEITADILGATDPESNQLLVDLIQDQAREKGTGRWTVAAALEFGVPAPTITAAVEARAMSSFKEERTAAAKLLTLPPEEPELGQDPGHLIEPAGPALHVAQVCVYSQGLALLRAASTAMNYGLRLEEVARIWRGGCIIRSRLLEKIRTAYQRDPELPNLLLDPEFAKTVMADRESLVQVVREATRRGLPVPALSASLAYLDSYRSERLPANLIQAQRDYFGAHTFERLDKPGNFHYAWKQKNGRKRK